MNDQLRETIEQKIEERVCNEMSDTQTGAGYAAIWVALSNGYSSDAIDAARSAGAMGGTILKGRRQNSERISRKLGISMQEEEEFVVIVTPREKKAAVMNAISDACGLRTDAHGIILSLPVDEVIGLETRREHAVTFLNKNRKCRRQPACGIFLFLFPASTSFSNPAHERHDRAVEHPRDRPEDPCVLRLRVPPRPNVQSRYAAVTTSQ